MRALLLAIGVLCTLTACAAPRRMCAAPGDCGAQLACVAGRCQADDRLLQAQGRGLEIQREGVRRIVLAPVDLAYVRRGDASASVPPLVVLGRKADGDALLFLRFALSLPPTATILEAYILLDRDPAADADPSAIALHAARVLDPWDARSLSWARQPRIEDARATSTVVSPMRPVVRLDVRDLVRQWRAHSKSDQGLVIVAENASRTGIAFAATPAMVEPMRDAERLAAVRTPPPAFFAGSADESAAPTIAHVITSGPRLEH